MKIIDGHKGMNEYTIHFGGLAGHSSKPHKGVNAIEYASRYINKLLEIRQELIKRAPKDCIFDPPHSTLSIGGISGGIAHNVIAFNRTDVSLAIVFRISKRSFKISHSVRL